MWSIDQTMNRQEKATWRKWDLCRGMRKQKPTKCEITIIREKEVVFM